MLHYVGNNAEKNTVKKNKEVINSTDNSYSKVNNGMEKEVNSQND